MGKKILLVEDETYVREMYEHVLTQHGYEVDAGKDGQEASDKLKENPGYDLDVLAILLP